MTTLYEYKVTRDVSMKNDNNPQVLEKLMNELGAAGWRLRGQVMSDAGSTSKIFLLWEREKVAS